MAALTPVPWPEIGRHELELDDDGHVVDVTICYACGGVIAHHEGGVHRGPDDGDQRCPDDCDRRTWGPDRAPEDPLGRLVCTTCGGCWCPPPWLTAFDLEGSPCPAPGCTGEVYGG